MTTEHVIITALAIVAMALSVICLRLAHRKNVSASPMDRIDPEIFAQFLRDNNLDGTIQAVASKVSTFLTSAFDCDRIVFLRKKRGVLELNYYHGIRAFNRRDFRTPYQPALVNELRKSLLPRPLAELKPFLPESVTAKIESYGIDRFFAILWKDNLYGVYFVRTTLSTDHHQFKLFVSTLAQSLAAAYHVKWHESKMETLSRRIESTPRPPAPRQSRQEVNPVPGLIGLLRHRDAQTLVPRIIDSLKNDLCMDRVAYVYREREADPAPTVLRSKATEALEVDDKEFFERLTEALRDGRPVKVEDLARDHEPLKPFVQELRRRNLDWLAPLPMSPDRPGILAFSGDSSAQQLEHRLPDVSRHVHDLVDNAESYREIEQLSYSDGLTGLANHRYFTKRLDEEIRRAQRYDRKLALIFFDMDDLKTINDRYGHQAGDSLLKQLAELIRPTVRAIDIMARYGGDEFCIIMPESDEHTCHGFMARLRAQVARNQFIVPTSRQPLHCTVSLGGAVFPDHADSAERLIYAADMALLQAKESGRNQCRLYGVEVTS